MNLLKPLTALSCLALLAGCVNPQTITHDGSDDVMLRFDSQFDGGKCQWIGEVTGSEGHWYSYLFYSNDTMIQGGLNDIKNNAYELGADTVFVISSQYFVTSATFLGSAYQCEDK